MKYKLELLLFIIIKNNNNHDGLQHGFSENQALLGLEIAYRYEIYI